MAHTIKKHCLVAKSCQLFATPWTIACQAPLSLGFPRQEHWSGLPFPSEGDLPDPGVEPKSPALTGGFFTAEPPEKPKEILASFIVHNFLPGFLTSKEF